MGTAEPDRDTLLIRSHIITYGHASTPALTEQVRDEIETMWNEPHAIIELNHQPFLVSFRITAEHMPGISDMTIYSNLNPCNNYFRIEEFAVGNISFVDGIGSNSGYFKLENLYAGSTTAAHEYGHTIGLDHPQNTDLRGKGVPGIMYPRGTLVDPQYQYDNTKPAGVTGGTMHPMYRKVHPADIALLKIERHNFREGILVLGAFTNYWHPDHRSLSPGESP